MSNDDFAELFQDFDPDVVAEFRDEFHDAYTGIEELLLQLEQQPNDRALIDDLFRKVHSIKSNLRMLGFGAHANFVHAVEEVLDGVRYARLQFDKRISDVVLLSVDHVRSMADASFAGNEEDDAKSEQVQQTLVRIAGGDSGAISSAIQLLDPDRRSTDGIMQQQEDIRFFASLAALLERRSPYWNGRYERVLALAQEMNQEAGLPIDPLQLQAAVYVHDVGMAFLPLAILHKSEDLDAAEQAWLTKHPDLAADLLNGMPAWSEAAEMVRQHQECVDGSGYPAGLTGSQIVPGAKLLAVIDAFESVTNDRADHHPRPLLRAVTEINSGAGTQFDAGWVDIFNEVIRRRRVRK